MRRNGLILEIILIAFCMLIYSNFGVIFPLWLMALLLMIFTWKVYNYATARIINFFVLFLITLCGDTNYLMFYAVVDFIIVCVIVIRHNCKISIKFEIASYWIVLTIIGIIGGLLFACDKISFHVGAEIYLLLSLLLLSSEFLYKRQKINFKAILWIICSTNLGIIVLFFSKNSISELLVTERALIYLLGDSGIRSNTIGGIIITFIVMLFYVKKSNLHIANKITCYAIVVLDIVILAFLQSRGSYVALAVVIIVSILEKIIIQKKLGLKELRRSVGILIVAIILFALPSIQNILNNYIFVRFFSQSSDISNGRFVLYNEAFDMWKLHPIVGNGFLQFFEFGIENADPHNFILGYLASCGILGTVALFAFLIKVLVPKYSLNWLCKPFRYAVLAQVIHGLFEPVLTTNLPLSLFLVTCILSIASKRTEYSKIWKN